MHSISVDMCGCFPTGRHYPGISHLINTALRGIDPSYQADTPWIELPIALIDVETTGIDSSVDRVVEIGISVGQHGKVIAKYNWLVQPGILIPKESTAVHGITDEIVKYSQYFKDVAHEISAALHGCIPAAYNSSFDKAFLISEFARSNIHSEISALKKEVEWLDPLVWAREIQHEERSRALGEVASRLGVSLETAHRASSDAEAALMVLYRLSTDPRMPLAYGAFVYEQRRLAQLQSDSQRRWKNRK